MEILETRNIIPVSYNYLKSTYYIRCINVNVSKVSFFWDQSQETMISDKTDFSRFYRCFLMI